MGVLAAGVPAVVIAKGAAGVGVSAATAPMVTVRVGVGAPVPVVGRKGRVAGAGRAASPEAEVAHAHEATTQAVDMVASMPGERVTRVAAGSAGAVQVGRHPQVTTAVVALAAVAPRREQPG